MAASNTLSTLRRSVPAVSTRIVYPRTENLPALNIFLKGEREALLFKFRFSELK